MQIFLIICGIIWLFGFIRELAAVNFYKTALKNSELTDFLNDHKIMVAFILFFGWPYFYFTRKV